MDGMDRMDAGSVDAVVCDPPYGLSFMGKNWDHGVPGPAFWTAALRVAKPGAHLLAFGGTRTFHRLACAIEDAGWEIRDTLGWLYGSGFPKSLDVGKAIDKAAGAERKIVGRRVYGDGRESRIDAEANALRNDGYSRPWRDDPEAVARNHSETAPATKEACKWDGWGTALKPAWEPIILARKPLAGTVAENVLAHGTGGINVDGGRVGLNGWKRQGGAAGKGFKTGKFMGAMGAGEPTLKFAFSSSAKGRWPANVLHDGSAEVLGVFPKTKSGARNPGRSAKVSTEHWRMGVAGSAASEGSAARFFYCAKASKADRDAGCEGGHDFTESDGHLCIGHPGAPTFCKKCGILEVEAGGKPCGPNPNRRNHHPTVKPTTLMRYLCRLITPPGGLILDPFAGSGSTGKAALLEGFRFVGIEREAEYCGIAGARLAAAEGEGN
jgi:site-specific DNA-methyltransferase (adenine-specific)